MIRYLLLIFLLSLSQVSLAQDKSWISWQAGYFDIHHISTGSGNATFFIFPDGTTLLFDAGDVDRTARTRTPNPLKASPPLPHDTVSAAQCIVHYLRHVFPGIQSIDYGIISHFHSDHYGSIGARSAHAAKGDYLLSGITEVHEYLPFHTLIDRNYPLYNYPTNLLEHVLDKEAFANYVAFVQSQVKNQSMKAFTLKAGSTRQIVLQNNPEKYSSFVVRNVKTNGTIWTGRDSACVNTMPSAIPLSDYNENPLSLALKFSYGKFDYFTGGDMTGLQGFGLPGWFDTESPVAAAVGPVDALSLNHHGVRDASNEPFLRSLAPRILVQQSWSSNHPGEEVLHRIISPFTYAGPRDIFATFIHPETITTYGRWLNDNYLSKHGHVVIRVSPGGDKYGVYILNDRSLIPEVLQQFGPYSSR
jgi:beta-lactamase superfamily II metal-dependent hydrolase